MSMGQRPPDVPKSGRRATTSADRLAMQRRYLAGETCAEIAADYPVTAKTVHQTLVSMGVQMRPPGGRPGRQTGGRRDGGG